VVRGSDLQRAIIGYVRVVSCRPFTVAQAGSATDRWRSSQPPPSWSSSR